MQEILKKESGFIKLLPPPTLSWVLGRHLDWSCICLSRTLYLWCCPITLLLPLSLPIPTCHPTGVRQSATGFEFLTLISAKLTLNTEEVPQFSILLSSAVCLPKLMTLIDCQKQGWACDAVIKVSGGNTNPLENNELPYNIKCQPTSQVIFLGSCKTARLWV